MDEELSVIERFGRLITFLNNKYGLNILYGLNKPNGRYGEGFFVVRNNRIERSIPINAGSLSDVYRWSDNQICRQVLASMGLLNQIEEKEVMPVYDQSPNDVDSKERAGRKAAETLLPFLNTKVHFTSVHALSILVAQWSGYGDSSSFSTGFMSVFLEYKDANKHVNPVIDGPVSIPDKIDY